MRILKIALFALFVSAFFAQAASAQKIIDVELAVFQNDTVMEKMINITEGRYSEIWRTGDYTLEFLDKDKKTVGRQSIDIFFGYSGPVVLDKPKPDDKLFDSYFLSYRHPYNPEIKSFRLLHFDKIIFSKNLECLDCPKDIAKPEDKNYVLFPSAAVIAVLAALLITIFYFRGKKSENFRITQLED